MTSWQKKLFWTLSLALNAHQDPFQLFNFPLRYVSDCIGAECDVSVPETARDEEGEITDEQKDEAKFCEIQWQQKSPLFDGRKFMKKNFKLLDDTPQSKLSLSITKIDEEKDEDRLQIIALTSPMKVRSPIGYRSSYNIDDNPSLLNVTSQLNAASDNSPVYQSLSSIKTISQPPPPPEASSSGSPKPSGSPKTSGSPKLFEGLRKPSLLSLKSLSMSMRLLKNRGRADSFDGMESTTLETIDETENRKKQTSIFKLDLFEKNLKKFVTRSNEAEFQSYSDYTQQQEQQQNKDSKTNYFFKNQKVHARRSSMSDATNQLPQPRTLSHHHHAGLSTSSSNVKHLTKKQKDEHKKQVDRTAEMLREVRKRNMETSKRIQAPRRISTY